jgi:hypothetical protein
VGLLVSQHNGAAIPTSSDEFLPSFVLGLKRRLRTFLISLYPALHATLRTLSKRIIHYRSFSDRHLERIIQMKLLSVPVP